ncbi:HNH endonuclease [Paracoccus lichenicola]|nr:HNH endonuclease signature motif containing protein [Paracoccus lichenicola]
MMRDWHRHSKRVTSTKRWQVLRQIVLERDNWACVDCGTRRGRLEIDHIQSVRTRPDLAFDPANCAARCPSCHTKKTRIECGHPAPIITPERQAWGQLVAELATNPNPAT